LNFLIFRSHESIFKSNRNLFDHYFENNSCFHNNLMTLFVSLMESALIVKLTFEDISWKILKLEFFAFDISCISGSYQFCQAAYSLIFSTILVCLFIEWKKIVYIFQPYLTLGRIIPCQISNVCEVEVGDVGVSPKLSIIFWLICISFSDFIIQKSSHIILLVFLVTLWILRLLAKA